jgi:hypothetical protein
MKKLVCNSGKFFFDEPTNQNNRAPINDGKWKNIGTQPSMMEIEKLVEHNH